MRDTRWFRSRGWGQTLLGLGAAAVAVTNPSTDGVQTAAGCSGSNSGGDDWVEIQGYGASETWSLDGFHYWVGIPGNWEEGGPDSLDDLANTELEVTDGEGNPIAGQMGLYKIRRQSVVLTWRADSELPEGSTLRSTLVVGPGEFETHERELTVADAGQPFELPEVTDTWITETWTAGPSADCGGGGCTGVIGIDKVSALTWRLGWSVPSTAPWSLELVMTKGTAGRPLGPQWVGHKSWSSDGISLHVEGADEYCFKIVGTDFSSGATLTSEETCSEPGVPEEVVFTDLERLLNCNYPPDDEELRELWCEHRSHLEVCGGPTGSGGTGTGGSAGNGGASNAVNSGGVAGSTSTNGGGDTGDSTTANGTGGGANAGGTAGSVGAGGSGGAAGNTSLPDDPDAEPRLSKGGCWCSVPQAHAAGQSAFALGGLVLLGRWRRRQQRARRY